MSEKRKERISGIMVFFYLTLSIIALTFAIISVGWRDKQSFS